MFRGATKEHPESASNDMLTWAPILQWDLSKHLNKWPCTRLEPVVFPHNCWLCFTSLTEIITTAYSGGLFQFLLSLVILFSPFTLLKMSLQHIFLFAISIYLFLHNLFWSIIIKPFIHYLLIIKLYFTRVAFFVMNYDVLYQLIRYLFNTSFDIILRL